MLITGKCCAEKNNQLFFADSIGQPISPYKDLYQRLTSVGNNHHIQQLLENQPIQPLDFCIYITHYLFNAKKLNISNIKLIRFAFTRCPNNTYLEKTY